MAGGRAGDLRRDMAASLRSYWDSAAGYQRFLYALAAVFFVSGVVHSAVFLVDGGAWEGPVSWRKPISFALSFSLVSASFAWVGTWLPRRPVVGWLVFGSFGVASVGETFLITMQRWRGTASHFNSSSSFDELVFAAMGGLTRSSWSSRGRPPGVRRTGAGRPRGIGGPAVLAQRGAAARSLCGRGGEAVARERGAGDEGGRGRLLSARRERSARDRVARPHAGPASI